MTDTNKRNEYPVGGERAPVYALLESLGLTISPYSDKVWASEDSIQVSIFGAGSMASVTIPDAGHNFRCQLSQLKERVEHYRYPVGGDRRIADVWHVKENWDCEMIITLNPGYRLGNQPGIMAPRHEFCAQDQTEIDAKMKLVLPCDCDDCVRDLGADKWED